MITVREALAIATPEAEPPAEVLSDEEQVQLDALDAAVEAGCARTFNGRMFEMPVPTTYCSPAVIAALRRRYEAAEAGWTVGIFPRCMEGEADPYEVQMVFAPTLGRVEVAVPARPPQEYPREYLTREQILELDLKSSRRPPPRLLIRMPTRGRSEQAIDVLTKYRDMAEYFPIAIEVVVDVDDEAMAQSRVLRRLRDLGCVVTVGHHRTKVEACNGGRVTDWDVLLLASDDMVPVADGYAARVVDALLAHYPHLDGAVYFDDGYQHGNCCTLPVVGRRLYDAYGYVYSPAYLSLFCDQEQTELWRSLGRLAYVPERIIEHRHPAWGGAAVDALYRRNDALMARDRAVYEARRATFRPYARAGFDSPPLWLSVCVASLPERRASLERLLDDLHHQATALARAEGGPVVEVLVDDRSPPATIGEKRQALLERARGHFVAHVDDDDGVARDYLARVVGAIQGDPEVDCCSLRGVRQVYDREEIFHASVAYDQWSEGPVRGVHQRTPGHLNAVRRTLALEVGFAGVSHAEDLDFSLRLQPLLKREADTGDAPLYHYWCDPARGASRGDP